MILHDNLCQQGAPPPPLLFPLPIICYNCNQVKLKLLLCLMKGRVFFCNHLQDSQYKFLENGGFVYETGLPEYSETCTPLLIVYRTHGKLCELLEEASREHQHRELSTENIMEIDLPGEYAISEKNGFWFFFPNENF